MSGTGIWGKPVIFTFIISHSTTPRRTSCPYWQAGCPCHVLVWCWVLLTDSGLQDPSWKTGHSSFRSDSQKIAKGTAGHAHRPWVHPAPCKPVDWFSLWDYSLLFELQWPWKVKGKMRDPETGEGLQVGLSFIVFECWLEGPIPLRMVQCALLCQSQVDLPICSHAFPYCMPS